MSDFDIYPPYRLARIREEEKTRTAAIGFLKAFSDRVLKDEKRPPDHWIQFTAELLGAAATAADEDKANERASAIMKALYLDGRVDLSHRNGTIACSLYYMTIQDDISITQAETNLSENLKARGVDVSEETLRDMYNRYPRKAVINEVEDAITYGKENGVPTDFLIGLDLNYIAKLLRK